MPIPPAQHCAALIALSLAIGCGKDREKPERGEASALETALRQADGELAASLAISAGKLDSCEQLGASLHALDGHEWEEVALRGLVEELLQRGRGLCSARELAAWPRGVSTSLAQSILATGPAEAIEAVSNAPESASILRRRAELYFETGRDTDALELLIESLKLDEDEQVRGRAARLLRKRGALERALELCGQGRGELLMVERVATLAAMGKAFEAVHEIGRAEIHVRSQLAAAAVESSPDPRKLAKVDGADAEVVYAVAMLPGMSTKETIDLLWLAIGREPKRAEFYEALAVAQEKAGEVEASVLAWDSAARLSLGYERPVLAPIRLLASSGKHKEAKARALNIAATAHANDSAESSHLASLAYRYAGETDLAVHFARRALERSPGEGRYRSELAHRLVEAEKGGEAAAILAELLVCGSRGQPWHRHEIVPRLRALVSPEDFANVVARVPCEVADPDDLAESLNPRLEATEYRYSE